MGWTSLHKQKGQSTSEWFRKEYHLGERYQLLDIAVVQRREVYIAIKDTQSGKVLALVMLVSYSRGYYNFSYKDMDEFCGPYVFNCPERILNLLSPLTEEDDPHGFAGQWRQKCRERIAGRKTLPKITKGIIIDLGRELEFSNGASLRYFIREGKRWRSVHKDGDHYLPGRGYYKLDHKRFDYSIIENRA
jgi:hypothetical protein